VGIGSPPMGYYSRGARGNRRPSELASHRVYSLVESPVPRPRVLTSWQSYPTGWTADSTYVGAKAAGLFLLPRIWVPPFLVVTSSFHSVFDEIETITLSEALRQDERQLLETFLHWPSQTGGRPSKVLVRSNSPSESLRDRGTYRSYLADSTLEGIADAIRALRRSVDQDQVMCLILQVPIEPGLMGHMSNERRVTADSNRWLIEGLNHSRPSMRHDIISSRRASAVTPSILYAHSEREVLARLRVVGSHLRTLASGLFHCEWVWDGKQLWIVQCDEASVDPSQTIKEHISTTDVAAPPFEPTSSLRHFRDVPPGLWKKLTCPHHFSRVGLPVADIYVLRGDEWTSTDLALRGAIEVDLRRMCQRDVVIRCDLAQSVATDDTLLPTSKASRDASYLARFMDEVALRFASQGLKPNEWAFLIAFLVAARASAMVHAFPKAQRVQVDTLWGFPDGLLHFPHDTWYFYPGDSRTVRKLRYKDLCLLPTPAGWVPTKVGSPLDWASVLDRGEILTLAHWGLRLAESLNSEIQLMALARIGGERGLAACLPWHFTSWEVPRYTQSVQAITDRAQIAIIRSRGDLATARASQISRRLRGYQIRPESELIRDDSFLVEAALFAAQVGKPLYFEGSVLGHAYYIMARTGASVIPIAREPKEEPTVYNKLVRDQIPLIIRNAGGLARVRQISALEAGPLLLQKLVEEAFEARSANSRDLVEELADVVDVVEALLRCNGISDEALRRARSDKLVKRGGFEHLLYLEATGINSLRLDSDGQGELPLVNDDRAAALPHQQSQGSVLESARTRRPEDLARSPSDYRVVTASSWPLGSPD